MLMFVQCTQSTALCLLSALAAGLVAEALGLIVSRRGEMSLSPQLDSRGGRTGFTLLLVIVNVIEL